ncbi:hypothetical protein ABH930_000820 [Kitasatospora sp. GAS204A]|nr:hypothetical protein [Kitasatospora sp. GAS204B]
MSSRRSTGTLRARIALGVVTVVGAAGTIVGGLGAGSAAAQTVSLTLSYTCTFPVIGGQSIAMRIDSDIPNSVAAGQSNPNFAFQAVVTAGDGVAQGLSVIGVRIVEGSGDADVSVAVPGGPMAVTVSAPIPKTPIPPAGSFDIKAAGTAPALTFNQPGHGTITIGGILLHLVPEDANGNLTFPGKIDVPCALDAGQNNLVATFDITTPPPPPGPTTPARPTPTPTTRTPAPPTTRPSTPPSTVTSGSPVSGSPDPTSPTSPTSAAASTASDSPSPSPSDSGSPPSSAAAAPPGSTSLTNSPTAKAGGPSAMDLGLTLLAVGALVASAVAYRYGWSRRNRRRTGGG